MRHRSTASSYKLLGEGTELTSSPIPSTSRATSSFSLTGSGEGTPILRALFRVLESRGPRESMNMLRDIMESMKLVQAITGTGAAASFVHANAYSDTRGEAFGVLTALSTILSLMALIVTVIIYISIGLLEHDDMVAVEGYLVRYWITIVATIVSSIISMMLLVSAVVVDAFRTYSSVSAWSLFTTSAIGFIGTIVFVISSGRYVFTTGNEVAERKKSDFSMVETEGNSTEDDSKEDTSSRPPTFWAKPAAASLLSSPPLPHEFAKLPPMRSAVVPLRSSALVSPVASPRAWSQNACTGQM